MHWLRALDDGEFRDRLERSIEALNDSTSSTTLTRDAFLDLTKPAPE